uniref:Uncharacterized protein n=1 Tax=Chromera velia CCMP2878 TaxID=1169474 RepID=A0A0G4GP17_9ALVE|eukprot:Cvel_22695.t1-p1 / transcript=Cvel_22695.t1 / gene=Cvel_22695 / organism=Chromera_velia_CCMP2878 / gene_product=hypothetical protein / transcript_product=hypothetical protein / location=Cvel_scaffold2260:27119-28384(-) / protein_length=422 / sequence_SO=supercontig / SO=protein_coding / is_pseudo=false
MRMLRYSLLFLAFPLYNYMSLWFPRQAHLLKAIFVTFLAVAISAFWSMVLTSVGGAENLLAVARRSGGEMRPFCKFPCCCLGLIGKRRLLTKSDLRWLRLMTLQWCYIGVFAEYVTAFGNLETRGWVYVTVASRMFCVAGLKNFRDLTMEIMKERMFKGGLKHICMQLLVVIPALINLICSIPGVVGARGGLYDRGVMAMAATNFGNCLVAPLFSILGALAFPPSEFENPSFYGWDGDGELIDETGRRRQGLRESLRADGGDGESRMSPTDGDGLVQMETGLGSSTGGGREKGRGQEGGDAAAVGGGERGVGGNEREATAESFAPPRVLSREPLDLEQSHEMQSVGVAMGRGDGSVGPSGQGENGRVEGNLGQGEAVTVNVPPQLQEGEVEEREAGEGDYQNASVPSELSVPPPLPGAEPGR